MGYDTRLIYGPRMDDETLRAFVPRWAIPRSETLAYDDLIDRKQGRILGVARGERCTFVMDPTRAVSAKNLRAWSGAIAANERVLSLDLCEARDDFAIGLYRPKREPVTAAWEARALVHRSDASMRLPRVGSSQALFALAESLGFSENPLDLRFSVWASRAPRASVVDSPLAFGPPFLRVLVLSDTTPARVLARLGRYAAISHDERLTLGDVLGGCMSARQIAIGACGDATILFDESGSLAFDLRWLLPNVPSRALSLWGDVARADAAPSARHDALDRPPTFGYALRVDGAIRRRVTWEGGKIVSTANRLPPALLSEIGAPLDIERDLRRAKAGAHWKDVIALMRGVGFDALPRASTPLDLDTVTPHHVAT